MFVYVAIEKNHGLVGLNHAQTKRNVANNDITFTFSYNERSAGVSFHVFKATNNNNRETLVALYT